MDIFKDELYASEILIWETLSSLTSLKECIEPASSERNEYLLEFQNILIEAGNCRKSTIA